MTSTRNRTLIVRPLIAGAAGVAGSYVIAGLTPGFVAAPVDGFLARTVPGIVIAIAIQTLGSFGHLLNFATAIALTIGLLGLAAAAGIVVAARIGRPIAAPTVGGALAWGLAVALTGAPVPALGGAVAVAGFIALTAPRADEDRGAQESRGESPLTRNRRRLLGSLATLVGFGGIAFLLGNRPGLGEPVVTSTDDGAGSDDGSSTGASVSGAAGSATPWEDPAVDDLLAEAERKDLGVDGHDTLVSETFYEVDINSVNPTVDPASWTLAVTGAVETERTYTHADLVGMEAEHRFNTLRCVGEALNGQKMDNALWTGVPIMDCVDAAGPIGNHVVLRAADGYYEGFPLAALRTGFLAFGMNGGPLARRHGAPVRALIPGHWGEINVKWLTEIEVTENAEQGYWEQRGWHGTGPVNTVAKLHAVNHLDDDRIEVAGHTYAGLRGVQAVDVSTNGGRTWTRAEMSEALPGEDVWRQWRYEYDSPGESHEVVVRAIEADGTVQPQDESRAFPSGPSGWVSRRVQG